jgi:hypothetical protein
VLHFLGKTVSHTTHPPGCVLGKTIFFPPQKVFWENTVFWEKIVTGDLLVLEDALLDNVVNVS